MPELVNPCHICGKAPAEFTCQKCGKTVCRKCFNPETGLCRLCSPTEKPAAAPKPAQEQFLLPESAKPLEVSPKDTKKMNA